MDNRKGLLELRNIAAARMTPEEVAEAARRVAAWKPTAPGESLPLRSISPVPDCWNAARIVSTSRFRLPITCSRGSVSLSAPLCAPPFGYSASSSIGPSNPMSRSTVA